MFFVIISTFLFYFFSVANTIYGGDSGDLVAAMLTRGVPHPSGYPLYTFLGVLFLKLPLNFLTPAGRAALISVAAYSLSFGLLYKILRLFSGKKNSAIVIFTALVTVILNKVVWLYAAVPEVFPLNVLIILTLFYTTLRFYDTKKLKYLFIFSLFVGLGITHHHTFFFLTPSSIYLIFKRRAVWARKTVLLKGLFWFAVGLLPLLYIFWSLSHHPEIAWAQLSPNGFLDLLFRRGYGTFVPGSFITNFSTLRFIQLVNLFFFVWADFSFAGLIVIFIGLLFIVKTRAIVREKKIFLLLTFFLFGPFFFFYANFPLVNDFNFATVERFMIIFYFFMALPFYFGLLGAQAIIRFLLVQLRIRMLQNYVVNATLVLFLLVPFTLFLKNHNSIGALKNSRRSENLGADVFSNAVPHSILLLDGDTVLFNSQYVYYANRSVFSDEDKLLIHANKLPNRYYRQILHQYYPALRLQENSERFLLTRFYEENVNRYSFFSNSVYPEVQTPGYTWRPYGLLFRYTKDDTPTPQIASDITDFWIQAKNRGLATDLTINRAVYNNLFLAEIPKVYAVARQNDAFFFMQNNDTGRALENLAEAIKLNPSDPDNYYLSAKINLQTGKCEDAFKLIQQALTKQADRLYLDTLQTLKNSCFTKPADTARVEQLLKKYETAAKVNLKDF